MVIRRPAALHATSERLETRTYALKPPPPPWLLNRPHVGVGCCRSRYANGARLGASARREQPALRSSSVSPFWANRSTRQASSSPWRGNGEEGGRQAPSQAPAGHGWSMVVLSSHSASNSSESVPRGDVPRLAGTAAMETSAPAVTRISNVGPAACWKPSRHAPRRISRERAGGTRRGQLDVGRAAEDNIQCSGCFKLYSAAQNAALF